MNPATTTNSEQTDNTDTSSTATNQLTTENTNSIDVSMGSPVLATSAVSSTSTTSTTPAASAASITALPSAPLSNTTTDISTTAVPNSNSIVTPAITTGPSFSPTPQQPAQNLINTQQNEQSQQQQQQRKIDKEREMAQLLVTMDNYTPIIPDAVIDYYLNKTGFDCDDARIKKLFALAAQKFVADIATDAFQFNKIRQASFRSASKSNKEKKAVLTMDDLSSALDEYGVNVKKPDYYN